MKKLLWILGTVATCVVWFFLVAIIAFGIYTITYSNMRDFNENIVGSIIFIGWGALTILSIVMWRRWKFRCQTCKRWGALKLERTELIKQEKISVLVELDNRNWNNEVIGTHDEYIPGKRKTYQNTYRCKHCGSLASSSYTEDNASI